MDRDERLRAEYRELRDDERQWGSRAVSLGSFYLVAVGTTAFFLLNNPARTQPWIDIVAPVPSFGIVAITVRQAITATVRGRLLLAYERALAPERYTAADVIALNERDTVPIGSSFHAQQPWLQAGVGKALTWFERGGLVLLVAVCYLAIREVHGASRTISIYVVVLLALALVACGYDGLAGSRRLEQKISRAGWRVAPRRNKSQCDDSLCLDQ